MWQQTLKDCPRCPVPALLAGTLRRFLPLPNPGAQNLEGGGGQGAPAPPRRNARPRLRPVPLSFLAPPGKAREVSETTPGPRPYPAWFRAGGFPGEARRPGRVVEHPAGPEAREKCVVGSSWAGRLLQTILSPRSAGWKKTGSAEVLRERTE